MALQPLVTAFVAIFAALAALPVYADQPRTHPRIGCRRRRDRPNAISAGPLPHRRGQSRRDVRSGRNDKRLVHGRPPAGKRGATRANAARNSARSTGERAGPRSLRPRARPDRRTGGHRVANAPLPAATERGLSCAYPGNPRRPVTLRRSSARPPRPDRGAPGGGRPGTAVAEPGLTGAAAGFLEIIT